MRRTPPSPGGARSLIMPAESKEGEGKGKKKKRRRSPASAAISSSLFQEERGPSVCSLKALQPKHGRGCYVFYGGRWKDLLVPGERKGGGGRGGDRVDEPFISFTSNFVDERETAQTVPPR